MCNKKLSLFDALLEELDEDLKPYTQVQSSEILGDLHRGEIGKTDTHPGRIFAIHSLRPGLIKRYIGPTKISGSIDDKTREHLAEQDFISDNERCRLWNLDPFLNCDEFSRTVKGEVQVLLSRVLDGQEASLTLSNVARHLHVGPGKSAGITKDRDYSGRFSQDAGTYARLCEGPMSFSSPTVAKVYKACTLTTRLTYMTEAVRLSLYGGGDSFNTNAHFCSVRKTNVTNRGICTQPSGNMVLQLSTHEILCEILIHSFGCDLSTQQNLNRELALKGSRGQCSMVNASWNWCTVDLTSASNFPWMLIVSLFPSLWVEWLSVIRSSHIVVGEETLIKHMCSSMGNGFTFALMTVLLSAVVKVLYELAALPEYDYDPITGVRTKTWAVYGDDIIVDKRVFNALLKVLNSFGFTVNSKKTFHEGLFRESCGGDYYDGYPVRPVFLESLDSQTDIYSLLNRLAVWGVQHSVPLPRALSFLRKALGKNLLRVPNWEDVSHGLHVPFSLCDQNPIGVPSKIKDLLNKGNVPYETLIPSPKKRVLFQEKTRDVIWLDAFTRRWFYFKQTVSTKSNMSNAPGMLLCMLEGSVRAGQYGLRPLGETVYRNVWKIAPSWGDPQCFLGTATPVSWNTGLPIYHLWEEYIRRNIYRKKF